MRKRTKARVVALKILYAWEMTKDPLEECHLKYWEDEPDTGKEVREFADHIVFGVSKNKEAIDKAIIDNATNWTIKRMAAMDRNILRIASFELLFSAETPPKVAINEAIDLAKMYGDDDSGRFVNGVLDKVLKNLKKERAKA